MGITFEDIFSQSQDLSSYEGRTIVNGDGESMYESVHLTEQDMPIVNVSISHALSQIAAALRLVINDVARTADGGVVITLVKDRTLNVGGCTDKAMKELLASYVMYEWLQDKSETRSEAYKLIFENMLAAIRSTISRKRPTL